jgi:hypothetical protein
VRRHAAPGPDGLWRLPGRNPGQCPFLPGLRPGDGIRNSTGDIHPQGNPLR